MTSTERGQMRAQALKILAILPLAAIAGCGERPTESEAAVSTAAVVVSCGSGCQEFTDLSGLVHVRLRTCSSVTSTRASNGLQQAEARCPMQSSTVDADWNAGYVLVGGGAEIIGSPQPGVLLKTSMADVTNGIRRGNVTTQWVARSGQYSSSTATHSLRAFSVGLRLVGLTADELSSGWNFLEPDSQGNLPGVPFTEIIPPDFLLIGGGATAFDTPNPTFLTASEPDFAANGWVAETHTAGNLAETAPPKAVAIGLNPCPVHADGSTAWEGGCLGTTGVTNSTNDGTGYATLSGFDASPFPAMLTSISGRATSTTRGAKRFLTDLIPVITSVNTIKTWGFTVTSKDASTPANGRLAGGQIQLFIF